jgi:hypothetical protein
LLGTEALAARKLTQRDLSRRCVRIYRNVYRSRDGGLTARDRAVAAWLWSGKSAVVAGSSAAALLGAKWLDVNTPAELLTNRKRRRR